MTRKHAEADIADLEAERDQRAPRLPVVVHGPSDPFAVANPAGGDVVFFDAALAFAYGHGLGSITLTTNQQLIDSAGVPYDQRRISVILKASLPALAHLKNVIVEIERRAHGEVAAAVAAQERPAGLAH